MEKKTNSTEKRWLGNQEAGVGKRRNSQSELVKTEKKILELIVLRWLGRDWGQPRQTRWPLSVENCNSLKIIEGNSAGSIECPDSSITSSLMDGNSFPFGLFPPAVFLKVGFMGQRLCFPVCCGLPGHLAPFCRKSVLGAGSGSPEPDTASSARSRWNIFVTHSG